MKDLQNYFESPIQIIQTFTDEKVALRYLEKWRWPEGVRCPHCGFNKIYKFKTREIFKCKECRSQFSAKVGTIFEKSQVPLFKWFLAGYFNACTKKGVSSRQLAKDIQVTQRTAWFMLQRIRQTMKQDPSDKLETVVELDETFVGGKNKNRHADKKVKYGRNRDYKDKVPVLGMVQRDGKVKTFVLPKRRAVYIQPLIRKHIKKDTILYTDEYDGYCGMGKDYQHAAINHSKKQFKDGDICTNRMEGFWTQLKRSLYGIYHRVSPKYLQRYTDEACWRYNTRHMKQGQIFNLFMSKINDRITLKQLQRA